MELSENPPVVIPEIIHIHVILCGWTEKVAFIYLGILSLSLSQRKEAMKFEKEKKCMWKGLGGGNGRGKMMM